MRKLGLAVLLSFFCFSSFAFAEDMPGHQHGMMSNSQGEDMSMETTKVYVCPMDQYTSDKAGRCKLCGMNLEEKEMSSSDAKAALEKSKKT